MEDKPKKKDIFEHGITLIALIITIIVLLILAGVSISLVVGENGILKKATNSVEETIKAQYEEELNLILATMRMDAMENSQKFTMQYIIEKLPSYLEEGKMDYYWDTEQNLEQLEEPEGIYKEYEFYIDTRHVAHIRGEINENERPFKIAVDEITTTSFKIIGDMEDLQQINATKYTYRVQSESGDTIIEHEDEPNTTYTVTGLQAETNYLVYMLAYDSENKLLRESRKQSVTTIYNPKINYPKEESLTLQVEVMYPEIKNVNVRNEYSIDGKNYSEYSSPVEIKDDCTFYARILNDMGEIVAYNEEKIDNINYVWKRWNVIEKFRYDERTKANYPKIGGADSDVFTVYSQMQWTSQGATINGETKTIDNNVYPGWLAAIGMYYPDGDGVVKIEKVNTQYSRWLFTGTRYYKEKVLIGYDKSTPLPDVESQNLGDHVNGEVEDNIWYELKSKE